ncbi:DUF4249 family protein [Lunatibacter salilacus]|uniref:DUF4249 family protein n=1 Tax=Lunatibacter salilacus TaxID=2483804 RepID=UPI001F2EBD60|nr:DUF4249 family protein [Lunatibacter salilacus]
MLFDDRLFDGEEAIMDLLIQGTMMEETYEGEIYFNLKSVTESYYQYHTTSDLQDWNEGDPFAQPVQVFSNIPNGLGILMGSTLDIFQYK